MNKDNRIRKKESRKEKATKKNGKKEKNNEEKGIRKRELTLWQIRQCTYSQHLCIWRLGFFLLIQVWLSSNLTWPLPPWLFCQPKVKQNLLGLYFKHLGPGRVAQSVGHLTRKSGVLGSTPGLATYFRFSFRFFKKGICHLLAKVCARTLVNRLGGLSLPRKSVVRLTDRPDMTLDGSRGRKTTMHCCCCCCCIVVLRPR